MPLGVHVAAEIYTLTLNERPCIGTPLVGKMPKCIRYRYLEPPGLAA